MLPLHMNTFVLRAIVTSERIVHDVDLYQYCALRKSVSVFQKCVQFTMHISHGSRGLCLLLTAHIGAQKPIWLPNAFPCTYGSLTGTRHTSTHTFTHTESTHLNIQNTDLHIIIIQQKFFHT